MMNQSFKMILVVLLAGVLTACGGGPALVAPEAESEAAPAAPADTAAQPAAAQQPTDAAIVVTDRGGRELRFEQPPQRVVCYYNSCYGMLATLGVMPIAQAVNPEMLSDPIYFNGEGTTIYTLRRDGDSIDVEDVAAQNPDLVIVWGEEEVQALEGIAPAFMELDGSSLDDIYAALRTYGTLLGRESEAEAAIARFSDRLDAYAALAPRDVTVAKIAAQDDQQFSIATRNDPICQILNRVAQCDWADPTGNTEWWSYDGSLESVLALNPDVIILNNWSEGDDAAIRSGLEANPLWNELTAVQNGRVLSTPGYNNPIASSLPAAQKFLDTYMPLLYPEVFPAALTDAQVQELAGE